MSTKPTDVEVCELLIRELTPKDLTPIAEMLGADKKLLRQYDNMREFVLARTLPQLRAPFPQDAQALLKALQTIAGA